jgi:hypothetical protein
LSEGCPAVGRPLQPACVGARSAAADDQEIVGVVQRIHRIDDDIPAASRQTGRLGMEPSPVVGGDVETRGLTQSLAAGKNDPVDAWVELAQTSKKNDEFNSLRLVNFWRALGGEVLDS